MATNKRLVFDSEFKWRLKAVIKNRKRMGLPYDQLENVALGLLDCCPTVDAVEVVHGRWEDGRCSNCQEEALYSSWDEPIYDYDWEENVRYSHTETHTEYHLTGYCPNCGAKMDGERKDNETD